MALPKVVSTPERAAGGVPPDAWTLPISLSDTSARATRAPLLPASTGATAERSPFEARTTYSPSATAVKANAPRASLAVWSVRLLPASVISAPETGVPPDVTTPETMVATCANAGARLANASATASASPPSERWLNMGNPYQTSAKEEILTNGLI